MYDIQESGPRGPINVIEMDGVRFPCWVVGSLE